MDSPRTAGAMAANPARDYERLPASHQAMILRAMIALMAPGPGPPGVSEHPREGLLPSRCAETRQARAGPAARVQEPPPGATP